jgi:hypothetical protein
MKSLLLLSLFCASSFLTGCHDGVVVERHRPAVVVRDHDRRDGRYYRDGRSYRSSSYRSTPSYYRSSDRYHRGPGYRAVPRSSGRVIVY